MTYWVSFLYTVCFLRAVRFASVIPAKPIGRCQAAPGGVPEQVWSHEPQMEAVSRVGFSMRASPGVAWSWHYQIPRLSTRRALLLGWLHSPGGALPSRPGAQWLSLQGTESRCPVPMANTVTYGSLLSLCPHTRASGLCSQGKSFQPATPWGLRCPAQLARGWSPPVSAPPPPIRPPLHSWSRGRQSSGAVMGFSGAAWDPPYLVGQSLGPNAPLSHLQTSLMLDLLFSHPCEFMTFSGIYVFIF